MQDWLPLLSACLLDDSLNIFVRAGRPRSSRHLLHAAVLGPYHSGGSGRLFRRHQRARLGLRDLGGVARIAIDKRLRRLGSLLAGKPHHLAMIGRKRASWVGVARISSDRHGLAAAAAEVDLAKGARAAGLLHP